MINDAFQTVDPTGLTLASGAGIAFVNEIGVTTGRILATWTAPADTFITNSGSVEVQWQPATIVFLAPRHGSREELGTDVGWSSSGYLQGATESYIVGPCIGGSQYNVRVRGTRSGGVTTNWVEVGPYTVSTTTQTIDAAAITGTLDASALPVATSSVAGAVVPDGTTLMVTGGVLSSVMPLTSGVPTSTATSGSMAFDPATSTLYLYGGAGWAAV